MMVMVFGEIVGQHFAVEAPQGMNVARPAAASVFCRDLLVGDHAIVVDEHWFLLLGDSQRGGTVVRKCERGGSAWALRAAFEAKTSRLGSVTGRRDIDHDPAAVALLGPIGGDLRNRLNREPIAGLIDFDQLPARAGVNTLRQVHGDVQRRLGGGDDKDWTIGLVRASAGRECPRRRISLNEERRKADIGWYS